MLIDSDLNFVRIILIVCGQDPKVLAYLFI